MLYNCYVINGKITVLFIDKTIFDKAANRKVWIDTFSLFITPNSIYLLSKHDKEYVAVHSEMHGSEAAVHRCLKKRSFRIF